MKRLMTRGRLLALVGLLLAVGLLAGVVRRYEAGSQPSAGPAGKIEERAPYIPGLSGVAGQGEAEELAGMADFWNARLTFPTGKYDGAWLLEAIRQDALVPEGVPAGRMWYNRGDNQSPLDLDPNSFTSLGPRPAQSNGCASCFNYGKVSGRVNSIAVHPTDPSIVFIGVAGGGVWKTTNCCSTDTTWVSTMDDAAISTTGLDEVTFDPNNPDTIYVATGDFRLTLFIYGSRGILKSTDQGATWTVKGADVFTPTYELNGSIPNPYRWQYQAVSAIKVDPNNSNNLVAGTKTGVFFSNNAGDTWTGPCYTNPYGQSQRQDVTELLLQDEGQTTTIYAAIGFLGSTAAGTTYANGANGIYTTTLPTAAGACPADWRLTTTESNGWPAGTGNGQPGNDKPGRIDMAIAPGNPDIIYAEVANASTQGLLGVWRTTDRGATWQQRATGAAILTCNGAPGNSNQNWYDQSIDVDPNNSDVIWIGAIDLWKSTDGGATYWNVTCGYTHNNIMQIHVDQHDTRYIPGSSSRLLAANDGGIYITDNADVISPTRPVWVNMNETLNTLEFYGGDTTAYFATAPQPGANGGTQDNGSMVTVWPTPGVFGPREWQVRKGGDGMFARIEPVFGLRWYQESQNGNIDVSTTGPFGPRVAATGAWGSETRGFVFPYEIFRGNPNDPKNDCNPTTGCTHMIAGTQRVWETIQGAIPTSSWYPNSPTLVRGIASRNYINQVTYSTSISTTAMVGTMDGYVWYGFGLGQGTANTATWTNVTTGTNGVALPERPVTDVGTDPIDPLVGYAVLAGFDENTPGAPGHVFQVTCTAGCAQATWANKTGNLPNFPVNAIAANPRYPRQVFAGNDLGLYYTNDITANPPTWNRFTAGLPTVKIWDLSIDRGYTTLVVWSRSRGAYAWPLPDAPIGEPTPTSTPTETVTPTSTATVLPCELRTNICHRTGSSRNPSYELIISCNVLQAHLSHGDTFPVPGVGCPAQTPHPEPTAFSDVEPTNPFYDMILDLYEMGAISGYADGTFRWGNSATRAQLVKIVVVAFDITPLPGNPQRFSDVPTDHPFFAYIEAAFVEGIISGYTCGGPGEPCDEQNRPYFRPYNNMTRGQLSKVVTIAAEFDLLNPTTPTYSDVPADSAFYTYVETAYANGIISGYSDGTFRPNVGATRGQLSKIIDLATHP